MKLASKVKFIYFYSFFVKVTCSFVGFLDRTANLADDF